MNEKIEVPAMKVPPLKKICMTIGQLPTAFIETMSYYEMLLWFIQYLRDDIIPVVNGNGEATQELQELYVELQQYVNDSFDELNLQAEVDKKLEEMLEDGSLGEIIMEDLNFKVDKNTMNDNTGITIEKHTLTTSGNTTTYYITKIPYLNKSGERNILKQGLANGIIAENNAQTVRQFSIDNKCKLAFNGSIFNSTNKLPVTKVLIQDGVPMTGFITENNKAVLGIKRDGTLKAYPNDAECTAENLLADGVLYSFTGFFTLMEDGVSVYDPTEPEIVNPYYYQRQIIAQCDNKDIYILTSDGKDFKENINQGLSIAECMTILSSYDITFAYMLDGGGSTSLVYNNTFINQPSDNNFTTERTMPLILYVEDNAPDEIKNIETTMGNIKHESDENKANMIYKPEIRNNEIKWYEVLTQPILGIRLLWSNITNKLQLRNKGMGYYNYDNDNKIFDVDTEYPNETFMLYNKSRVAPRNQVKYIKTAIDLDTINYSAEFFIVGTVAQASKLPTANDYYVICRRLNNFTDEETATTNGYYIQIAFARSTGVLPKYRWSYNNANWTTWTDI